MAGKYSVRWMEKEALDDAADVLSKIFKINIDAEYMDWKFFRNPAGKHLEHLAIYENQIVGAVGATPVHIRMADAELTAALSGDLFVDSAHRKAGVFLRLVRDAINYARGREVRFLFGFANDISTKVNFATGFRPVGRLDDLTLTLDVTNSLKKRLKSGALAGMAAFFINPILRLRHNIPRVDPGGLLVKKISSFDERFDRLWESEKQNFCIVSVKNKSYLNWRYVDNPINFDIFAVEEKDTGEIAGYTVLCVEKYEDRSSGRIMDCFYIQNRPEVLNLLYATIYKHFKREKCRNIHLMGFRHMHLYKYLLDRKFKPSESAFSLIVHFLGKCDDAEKELLQDPLNWNITPGDTDHRGNA